MFSLYWINRHMNKTTKMFIVFNLLYLGYLAIKLVLLYPFRFQEVWSFMQLLWKSTSLEMCAVDADISAGDVCAASTCLSLSILCLNSFVGQLLLVELVHSNSLLQRSIRLSFQAKINHSEASKAALFSIHVVCGCLVRQIYGHTRNKRIQGFCLFTFVHKNKCD